MTWQVGQVCRRAFLHASLLVTVALAQQRGDMGRALARDADKGDVHGLRA